MTTNGRRAVPRAALLAGVLLVGPMAARWGMSAAFTQGAAIRWRKRSLAHDSPRGALGDTVAGTWSEALRADVALAERNDRYAG